MIRCQLLARELLRRADVDEGGLTYFGQHLVAEDSQLGALGTRDAERGLLVRGDVRGELTALELPLLAPTVEQLDVLEPPVLEQPGGVGGNQLLFPPYNTTVMSSSTPV